MADRRMFTKKITDDDNFMSLSSSAQALYLHLSMSADDDGFCNQVSIAMFKAHASIQDLESLLSKRYIYQFENGVIVIKHWRMANALRKDRYTPTTFQEELKQLKIKDNGSYTMRDNSLVAGWLPDGCQVVAAGKDSIDKDSIDKDNKNNIGDSVEENFEKLWSLYPRKHGKGSVSKKSKKEIYKIGYETMAKCIELFKADMKQNQTEMKYYPYGSTFFNSGYKDYLEILKNQKKKKEEIDDPVEEIDDGEWSDERWEEEFKKRGI